MVKIIKGSYGMRRGKTIEAVGAGTIISIEKEQEERLVRLGVAEYVEGEGPKAVKEDGASAPEYSEEMKLPELKKIAESYGVDATSLRSKKEVIEAIEAAKDLPAFDADDTVQ